MTTRMHFCLAFWWKGLHATTTLLMLKWTFCLCVFNVSSKTAGQRQGQLSHRTAVTIVLTFANICVHGPSAPRSKLWSWKHVFRMNLGKIGLVYFTFCPEYHLFMLAVAWFKDVLKQQDNIYNRQIVLFPIFYCSISSLMDFWPTFSLFAKRAGWGFSFCKTWPAVKCLDMKYECGFLGIWVCLHSFFLM